MPLPCANPRASPGAVGCDLLGMLLCCAGSSSPHGPRVEWGCWMENADVLPTLTNAKCRLFHALTPSETPHKWPYWWTSPRSPKSKLASALHTEPLNLIRAQANLQVVANDSLSQLDAIFTMQHPEISGSCGRAASPSRGARRSRLEPVVTAGGFCSIWGFLNSFSFNSFLSLMGDWINSAVDFCDTKAADKSMMHSSYVV